MYLKRIESVGFKSFAERINIEFVPGLTAVVGPNGSGKSNITDAIRWVLGEQSIRSLRGSRMEDIIFQGSDSRRALNVAEVILTLDNTTKKLPLDYEEVSITRRVYRSGMSEFYINKQACRLKDIVDLFMDSGLGRDAFSIIGQGKVEEILSSKAEERRTIFEEAAGVLKYKQRKEKAEYKLAETEENLFRVEDIVHEIEQQLDPLEKQAKTAESYLEQKEQLKAEEIAFIITEIKQLHTKWEQLRKVIEDQKVDHITAVNRIQKKETTIEKKRTSIRTLDEEIEQLQSELLEQTKYVEQNEGEKKLFEERTKHASSNQKNIKQQIERLEEQKEQLQQSLVQEQTIEQTIADELVETKKQMTSIQERLSSKKETLTEKLEDQKAAYIEVLNEQAALRNELQSTERYMTQFKQKERTEKEKTDELRHQLMEVKKNYIDNKQRFTEGNTSVDLHVEDIEQQKRTLYEQRNVYEQAQQQLHEYKHQVATLQSRKDVLEEMKEAFQGFFHGVKRVLQARDEGKLQSIKGAIVELMEVPKKYTVAIETILGGQAQHIIVAHDEAAREAIAWLKKTNYGRATFLPLSSIQARFVPRQQREQLEQQSGFVGIASELVHVEQAYQKAVDHLMGHVLVANTLRDANQIAHMTNRRFRIVTIDGDVVNPGGSMSGGASKKRGSSLFTREHELEEVNKRLNNANAVIADKTEEVEQLRATISSLTKTIEQKEQELIEKRAEIEKLRELFYQSSNQYKGIQDQLESYEENHTQFLDDQLSYKEKSSQLQKEINAVEQRAHALDEHIEQLTEKQSRYEEDRKSFQTMLHRTEIEYAEQNERHKNQQYKVSTIEEQLKRVTGQCATHKKEYDALVRLGKSSKRMEQFEEQIVQANKQIEDSNKQIQAKRTKRYEDTIWIETEERELREEQKNAQGVLQKIQAKEVQENRLDVELENLLSHLQQEYTLTYERAVSRYSFVEDISTAKEHVSQLKNSIDQLGTVNIGAIEEFARITERHTFLTEQQTDLVEGKDTLYAIIEEMDYEMETRFSETFTQIKDEFSIVFKELFGGGTARLQLTDPNNLLETGIEIIAQPPGKKLQHLGLLSGGERSLTAIALLFAILRVRPVPFCVLDEVEAALDETNVTRFANYVKQHSSSTQFIVITHRKGTMEKADVLYGITMQESGVSRLVSVRLEETEALMKTT